MSFGKEVTAATNKIESYYSRAARAVFKELFDAVIRTSPADTGRFRGNWQTTRNTPAMGNVARFGASAAMAEVSSVLGSPGLYWLTNNLPYGPVLEYGKYGTGEGATEKTTRDGFSVQAPNGIVRIETIKMRNRVKKYLR